MANYKNEKKSGKEIPLYTGNNKKPLGLQDNGKLQICPDAPNCFSTSSDSQKNLLEVWSPKAGGDAMGELLAAVKAYPPGQSGACFSPGGSSSCVERMHMACSTVAFSESPYMSAAQARRCLKVLLA